MLLYLNDLRLTGSNEYTTSQTSFFFVQVLLVKERDVSKGGCDFGRFFIQAPHELINNPPHVIFKDIAITLLYGVDEYRAFSLRQILSKM